MIELYHGSNLFIDKIDFTKCKPYKDFGQGFYLTDIFRRQWRWQSSELVLLAQVLLS